MSQLLWSSSEDRGVYSFFRKTMDPITLVVTALASGATNSLKGVGTRAAGDAYDALKAYIKRRYSKISVDPLIQAPDSALQKTAIEKQLSEAGAREDVELHALARQLKELEDQTSAKHSYHFEHLHVAPSGLQSVGINTGTINYAPPERDFKQVLTEGLDLLENGSYSDATSQFRIAQRKNPDNRRVPFLMCLSLIHGSRLKSLHSQAIVEIERLLFVSGGRSLDKWPAHLCFLAALIKYHFYLRNGMRADPSPDYLISLGQKAAVDSEALSLLQNHLCHEDLEVISG